MKFQPRNQLTDWRDTSVISVWPVRVDAGEAGGTSYSLVVMNSSSTSLG